MRNVDDILTNTVEKPPLKVEVVNNEPDLDQEPIKKVDDSVDTSQQDEDEPGTEERLTQLEQFRKDKEEFLEKKNGESTENMQKDDLKPEKEGNKAEDQHETDEYGNKITKKQQKLYTEEEVNQRIRERLSRGKYAQEQQPTQQQVQQAAQDFKADPASEESWEAQLESFVVNTVQKLGNKHQQEQQQAQQEQWQAQERQVQEQFQDKFTSGMAKYDDFGDVVGSKPITNGMMMATRSMNDPAAFIYTAAKQQPAELERISKINDPYQQAAEMGRLEERMRKARTVSRAPKPSTRVKSDVGSGYNEKPSIDQRILADAKRKYGRR